METALKHPRANSIWKWQVQGKGNRSELPKSRILLISIHFQLEIKRNCFTTPNQMMSEFELDSNGKWKEYSVYSNGFVISPDWKWIEAALKHPRISIARKRKLLCHAQEQKLVDLNSFQIETSKLLWSSKADCERFVIGFKWKMKASRRKAPYNRFWLMFKLPLIENERKQLWSCHTQTLSDFE